MISPSLKVASIGVALDFVTQVRNYIKAHQAGCPALPQAAVPAPYPRQHHTFLLGPSSVPSPSTHSAAAATPNPTVRIWSILSLPQSQASVYRGTDFFFEWGRCSCKISVIPEDVSFKVLLCEHRREGLALVKPNSVLESHSLPFPQVHTCTADNRTL